MKLQIQTLTGETQEVEADPENSILDLKVCKNYFLLSLYKKNQH